VASLIKCDENTKIIYDSSPNPWDRNLNGGPLVIMRGDILL